LTVIVGPQVFHCGNVTELASGLLTLSGRPDTNFIPLYFGANARGALELGSLKRDDEEGLGLADVLSGVKRPKVIYLVGDVPFLERPDCDFLIAQDIYLPRFKVDAFLPAASFAECGGTLVNMEGRVQEVVQAECQPEGPVAGFMRPDWRILSGLARALECEGMDYRSPQDVDDDIHRTLPGFPTGPDRMPRRMKPVPVGGGKSTIDNRQSTIGVGGFLLVAEPAGYRHRGVDISSKVGGLGELALEEGFRMNPEDIAALGVKDGDHVTVTLDDGAVSVTGPARSNSECPRGVVYYTRPVILGGLGHRRALWPLYKLEQNPVRANVSKAPGKKA
jgi:hypothetical protein